MNEQLSAFKIKQGRRIYDIYNIVNSLSFALVTGNTITLYALVLNASTTVVGLLNAFMYLSFFAIPLGKLMVNRFTIMQTFGYTWLLRNTSLIPILAIPHLVASQRYTAALYCLLIAVGCFNIFRGAGMIANNPVIKILAPGKDRSSYIVRISLTNNLAALIATLLLAVLLSRDSSVRTYHIASVAGIILGFAASLLLFKLPEPHGKKTAAATPDTPQRTPYKSFKKFSFVNHIRDAFSDSNFRRFVLTFFIISLGISMIRPFIIVYAKEVYGQRDSIATVLSVFSVMGALIVGLVLRLVIDRIGAKPMYTIFAAMGAASLIPAIFAPWLGNATILPVVFLVLLSIVSNMGFVGQDNAAQAYFFAMVPEDALMDLSMLYYFILGTTGGLGSILGGTILDFLRMHGFNHLEAYRIFFIGIILIIAIGMVFQTKLQNLGSFRVFETLAVLLSPRDLRALNLLHKLDSNENLETEQKILTELGTIGSAISSSQLLHYLDSPRVAIRMNALAALDSMEAINAEVTDMLLKELAEGEFTTAAAAARLLGKFKAAKALPALRRALESPDYYLAGEAMAALAALNDERSLSKIGELFTTAENPALLLKGIQAMETFNAIPSIPLIFDLLRKTSLPPYIENEALLALASLMGIENDFYYLFEKYRQEKNPLRLITEAIDEAFEIRKITEPHLKDTLLRFMQDYQYDDLFAQELIKLGKDMFGVRSMLFYGVAVDLDLTHRESFRFFLVYWTVALLKKPELIKL
ncbi:MAG: MFS transporter [Treponema sp.]